MTPINTDFSLLPQIPHARARRRDAAGRFLTPMFSDAPTNVRDFLANTSSKPLPEENPECLFVAAGNSYRPAARKFIRTFPFFSGVFFTIGAVGLCFMRGKSNENCRLTWAAESLYIKPCNK